MNYHQFEILMTDPSYTCDDIAYDMSDMFFSLTDDPLISSVDIVSSGTQKAFILVGTGFLTVAEIETALINKLSEPGRDIKNYILLPLADVEM